MDEDQKKVQSEALEFYRGEGINVIPLMYREKKPIFAWKKYQSQKVTKEEEKEFFDDEGADNARSAATRFQSAGKKPAATDDH